ncbi:PAS-domain containing protein [Siccirubricoccus sp. G192]|uniref:PAS-domain containing protein n=1 Tax=Siccirubricoccus sp. G192 TaxID=2849651 RepID=UPI001C2CC407|nr:PAS-domain containing protein [Siccirubricoccus sp. G192]MBV1796114.1 PAS-domain containing protein [Siccirubricoccus sp. G192]
MTGIADAAADHGPTDHGPGGRSPALATAALAALPFGVLIYDPEHRLAYANDAAWRHTGIDPAQVPIGTPLAEVVRLFAFRGVYGPGDPEAQAARHLRLDRSKPFMRLLRHADGTCHELHSMPLSGGGFFSIATEVTGHLTATEEATALARRLETVLAHLHGGLALYDTQQRLVLNNPAYEDLIGLPRGTVRPGMAQEEVLRALVRRGDFANADPDESLENRRGIDRSRPASYQRERPNGQVLRFESQPVPEGGYLLEVTDITAAKRAEDEARRRAALLDGVLASLPHGVVVFGPDQRVAMVNAAYHAIMAGSTVAVGEHREEIARRRALAGEYGPGEPEALMRENLAARESRDAARQRVRPDGTVLDIRYAALPDGGRVQVTTDITALHQARAQATARATLLQLMLDNMRHGIALFDAEHRLVTSNALAARLMGLPQDRLWPGRALDDLIGEQYAAGELGGPSIEAVLARTANRDRSKPMHYTRTRPDGTVVEVISDPTPDGGFVCTYSDITARARAEAEAREQAGTLQATIDNLRHGIAVYGPDRRVRVANVLASELAGHAPGTVRPGRSLDEMVLGMIPEGVLEPGPDAEALVGRILAADRSRHQRNVRRARGGRVLEIHSDPMPDGGFIVSHIDITPLALAEAEAQARAATLQVMLDNMRHGIALYGPDRRLIAANQLSVALSGGPELAVSLGTTLEEIVATQLRSGVFGQGPEAERIAAGILAYDRSRPIRYQRVMPDGRIVEIQSDPTPDGGFVVTWSDITARAEAEQAARSRATLLQSMLDNTRHGIALHGPDRRLLVANTLAAELRNLPPEAMAPGSSLDELVQRQLELGTLGEGPEAVAAAAEMIGFDRSLPYRAQRTMPDGRIMEIASDPTPDGGFVITHSDVTELVAAKAEASARAALLEVMLDNMRHGIALFDHRGRLVAANELAARFTNLGSTALMAGQSMDDMVARQLAEGEIDAAAVAAAAVADRSKPFRYVRTRPDGTVLEVISDPTPDGGYVVTFSDVTALTRLEAEARSRAAILQVMLDNIRHGLCYYGPDRRVIAANALAAELGGHDPAALVPGRLLDDLIAEQLRNGAVAGDAEAVADAALRMDRSRPARYTRPSADGRIVEVSSDPTPDGGFVVTMADITPLARAEAEAQRRAGIQQAMLDNIRHGIALFDAEGRVVAANPVFRQLLDLPAEVLAPGHPYTDFVDLLAVRGEYGPGEEGLAVAAAIKGRDRNLTVRSVRRRPNGRVLEVVSDPTPDGGWVLTYTDVTEDRRVRAELERAKEAAEAANRAKSRFLATMSHELRTPLNAVIGFSEAFLADPDPVRGLDYVRSIHEAGRHLLALIDDILDVTRAETTGFQISEGEVDMVALAEGAVRVMRATAAMAQVAVSARLPPALPLVRADAVRLRQVLLNLLANAVKFTPAGGAVTLSAEVEPPGDLVLRVADTGIGMPPEDIPRAFEPFTQLDNSLSRRFQGSGLGLYLSRALAEAQGAELTLESAPGAGTTAVLRIPKSRLILPATA